jgi:hypothetical protein
MWKSKVFPPQDIHRLCRPAQKGGTAFAESRALCSSSGAHQNQRGSREIRREAEEQSTASVVARYLSQWPLHVTVCHELCPGLPKSLCPAIHRMMKLRRSDHQCFREMSSAALSRAPAFVRAGNLERLFVSQ